MAPPAAPLVAIVGPTASGKSALALRLARAGSGEIVSCDSLQVYRGLDIGSAKATAEERAEVRHHLVDVVDPDEAFSAAEYARLARAALADIAARGRLAIVAGGTGLYLRALLQGLFEGPSRDDAFRRRVEGLAERFGDARLHRLLSRVDPEAAARIGPQDRVRVVRALEVYRATGRPLSEQQRGATEPLRGFRPLVVGLDPGRAELRKAVEARTRAMLARGLLEEVRALLERGYRPELRPLRAIGYRQAMAVALGGMTVAEAEEAIVTETMRFAKRQRTWFRHQPPDVEWFADGDRAWPAILRWLGEAPGGRPGGSGGPPGLTGPRESVQFGSLRSASMLLIDIPQIPPEGLDIDEALDPVALHLEREEDLALRPGGRLRGHVEVVDATTVHVRGRLDGTVETDCARCLERYAVTLGQELDLFYLPRAAEQPEAEEEEVELSDRDVVVGYYENHRLDLGEVVREQILLGLPLKPLCREDCRGLCPRCGKNRNASPCGCTPEEEPGDTRLEPLRRLIDKKRQ